MFNSKSLVLFAGLLILAGNALAEEPDWSDYRVVLTQLKPVTKNGVKLALVDYPAIKADGSLDKAYRTVTAFDSKRLHGRNEQLAFYNPWLSPRPSKKYGRLSKTSMIHPGRLGSSTAAKL